LIVTNPAWLKLPGSGAITNHALFMAAYILAAVLIGDLLGQLMIHLGTRWWSAALATLLILGVGAAGARARMGDIFISQHALVTRPDLKAMKWIEQNTRTDARFLVNSFFAYGGTAIVGSDGGWWLPVLAKRANTVPPLTYGTEKEPWPGYRRWVNELTQQLQGADMAAPATITLLGERGITHVYIGQQQGRVNYSGPDALKPESLLASPYFRLIYHQDRVWVFEVVQ